MYLRLGENTSSKGKKDKISREARIEVITDVKLRPVKASDYDSRFQNNKKEVMRIFIGSGEGTYVRMLGLYILTITQYIFAGTF